jgi:23S rRNA (adenine2030-N6)-methyltransferase
VNYRHAFHAGNFADLVKHAALIGLLTRLDADPSPLTVVDTHAGAGVYDLIDGTQARSKEAQAGVARLMVGDGLPPALEALAARVRARNPSGPVETYPGSPALIVEALRPQDRYVACELRPDDHAALARMLGPAGTSAQARLADGFQTAVDVAAATPGRLALLIDPPFERADDYLQIVRTVGAVLKSKPAATFLIWLPLKDLETIDGFVRRLEPVPGVRAIVAETRLRPLHNPMKLNGCALVAIGAPAGFAADLQAISGYVARVFGEPGGGAKLWEIG